MVSYPSVPIPSTTWSCPSFWFFLSPSQVTPPSTSLNHPVLPSMQDWSIHTLLFHLPKLHMVRELYHEHLELLGKYPLFPYTIAVAKLCLLKEIWCSCLLGGSASTWPMQMWMLQPTIRLSSGTPVGELAEEFEDWSRELQPYRKNNVNNCVGCPDHPVIQGTRLPSKECTGRNPWLHKQV